jgi:hypothetical protein
VPLRITDLLPELFAGNCVSVCGAAWRICLLKVLYVLFQVAVHPEHEMLGLGTRMDGRSVSNAST